MITNASVTIYNKVYDRDEGSNKYYRTVLKGVNWQDATKVLPSDTGVVSADVAEVYIPFLIDTEKKYCSPVNFNSEQEKDKSFTLAPEDIIVKGVVTDELTKWKDVEHLKNKYGSVRVIAVIETNDNGSPTMQHWKVTAE